MDYNLGEYQYRSSTGKIYKKVFWFIYEIIDSEYHNYYKGVRKVNSLCGIEEEEFDTSSLVLITKEITEKGRYLAHFKEPGGWCGNDPLPAVVTPYKDGRLAISWDNGWSSVGHQNRVNIYELQEA